MTGGGSGGHITPILAVAAELKKLQPDCTIVYIGQRGDRLGDVPVHNEHIDRTFAVRAGKWRRYHGLGARQLLDVPTMFKNARDALYVLIGLWQSFWLLGKLKPDVVFVKGGFVGVPVGLAAGWRRIPYVTHDSDAVPGLANRIISKRAAVHAVALPKEVYAYPADKTVTVGVPVQAEFQPVDEAAKAAYRADVGLGEYKKVLLVTGGGQGAQRINEAVAEVLPSLLGGFMDLAVVHVTGRAHEKAVQEQYDTLLTAKERRRVVVKGYVTDLYRYSGAADVVLVRAGATTLAELAVQQKACILIPHPYLAGGHQLKNAEYLAEKNAAVIVNESDLKHRAELLEQRIARLLQNEGERTALAKNLSKFSRSTAAEELAMILLEQARTNKNRQ